MSLREEQYWQLLFPGYDPSQKVLPDDATVCTGLPIFSDPAFAGATPKGGGQVKMQEGDVAFGGGGARLKLVWFRTHSSPKGGMVGPLAIVRAVGDRAEVYAVGVYAGGAETQLGLERIGPEVVATTLDEGCAGRKPGQACDSQLRVFQPWRGELGEVAAVPLERVRVEQDTEPGVRGTVEYRLVSTPEYKVEGIKVLEQIVASDVDGHELRRAEQELWFRSAGGKLKASGESLWQRVYPAKRPGGAADRPAAGKKGANSDEAPPSASPANPTGTESE